MHMGWEALCDQRKESEGFRKVVDMARNVKLGKQSAGLVGQNVTSQVAVAAIVEKTFLGISEKDMRRQNRSSSHSSFFPEEHSHCADSSRGKQHWGGRNAVLLHLP